MQVMAYASGNPDFPGACGRCYEVKCAPGPVLGWENKPVDFTTAYSHSGGMPTLLTRRAGASQVGHRSRDGPDCAQMLRTKREANLAVIWTALQ